VGGKAVVREGRLVNHDVVELARRQNQASMRLLEAV